MRYPKNIQDFIAQNVQGRTTKELVELVNATFSDADFTESKMRAYKKNHKLKSETPVGLPKGHASAIFPQPVVDYILAHYRSCSYKEMAERLNNEFSTAYKASQINSFYGNHHLNSGLDGRFQKGHVSCNKGRKGCCARGCEKSWFIKGHIPTNHKPVGSERIDSKDGYHLVKTAEPNVWELKHRVLWESVNGPIPRGYALIFLDGNKDNITLENLALVTLAENARLNQSGLRSKDPGLTETGILIAKIKTASAKAQKRRTT